LTDNLITIYEGNGLHDDEWVVMVRIYGTKPRVEPTENASHLVRFRWRDDPDATSSHRWWIAVDVWTNETGWQRLWDYKRLTGSPKDREDDLADAMHTTKRLLGLL